MVTRKLSLPAVVLWCVALTKVPPAATLPENLLYDYKLSPELVIGDDFSSPEINLKVPIVFYGTTYKSIFVNTNGILSFNIQLPDFFNIPFPLDYPIVAPLYTNVDTTGSGSITYFQSADKAYTARATNNVIDAFSDAENFRAKSVFIATWDNVGYHNNGSDKLNTFQVAIYTDGKESFVEYLYPENGIQWIQGTGDETGLPDARAQAGFISNDGRYFTLPGSGTDQVRYLERGSNMNLPGQWLFRVGNIGPEDSVQQPDIYNPETAGDLQEPTTCATATTFCHVQANCTNYEKGFCCSCKKGYYGNGRMCIKKDVPLRVSGKIKGTINNIQFEELDLQSYIVMSDGRAYTAMSKIPQDIGFDIQSLQILGATIGWAFAKPVNDALNGFQFTGGTFNQTATVSFTSTGQEITVRQKFYGLDVFDQLKLETEISGEVPNLPVDSRISISEYQEQFTLTAPGVIQSASSHSFKYTSSDEEIEVPYTVSQNIVFGYCRYAQQPVGTTWKLKVGKNFISYESREQIIRFGMSNKITPFADFDPCQEGRSNCGPDSSCVVEDDTYRCVCNPGYQQVIKYGEQTCIDINECTTGIQDCDYNAQCINLVGSYQCQCNPGFEGNGKICENAHNCQNVTCGQDAHCLENGNIAYCTCLPGFTGNGFVCTPIASQSCNTANNCSPNGFCEIDPSDDTYACHCLPQYEGDGYTCTPSPTTMAPEDGKLTERCLMGVCWCPAGYIKDAQSRYCIKNSSSSTETTFEEHSSDDSCAEINSCHHNAVCLFLNNGKHQCSCKPGYEGDGTNCEEIQVSCSDHDICDIHATCGYSEEFERSICYCNEGYQGDGTICYVTPSCSTDDDCGDNEECYYSVSTETHDCVCKEGLGRDAQHQCVKLEGTCGGGTCVDNAECLYDDEIDTFYCSCKKEYVGDGITECKLRPIGCNVLNNCGLHATCDYDYTNGTYQCTCADGFHGDGFNCHAEYNCHINPALCHINAVCIPDGDRKYVCKCGLGYQGNGSVCVLPPKHDGNFLLVNQGIATLKVNYEAEKKGQGRPIQIKNNQLAVGLGVDCVDGKIYWTDINLKAIRSSAYNGSNKSDFILKDIGSPEGLTVDWVSRNIYWTDSKKDTIEVANIDNELRRVIIDTQLINPRGIAVHPQRGKIFWSDWNRNKPKIEWANADGSGREIFLADTEFVKLPNSVTIDFSTEQVCYADAGTKLIVCVDIDSRKINVMASNCTYPFGIAVTDTNIYWSDWISKKIEVLDKYTLKRLKPLDLPIGGTGNKLYALISVPDGCPRMSNVCGYRDQCPANYICLPDGRGSRKCACGTKIDSREPQNCNDVQ